MDLAPGALLNKTINITLTDENNLSVTKDFTLTVVGTNDHPDIAATVVMDEIPVHEDVMMRDDFVLRGTFTETDPEGDLPYNLGDLLNGLLDGTDPLLDTVDDLDQHQRERSARGPRAHGRPERRRS